MAALPKAVQKQVDEANRLAEQLSKERLNPTPPPEPKPPAADSGTPPPAAAAPPAADPPAGEPAAPSPAPAAPEAWEQKYRVLQGKYNAEVPRLQRTVSEQSSRIEQMSQQLTATQAMLGTLAQNRVAAPGSQSPTPAAPARLVKDEEVKEFGEDLTDFIGRVAEERVLRVVDGRIKPVQQQVEQVRQSATQVANAQAQTAQERLLLALDAQVPDWRQLNNDESFLSWLDQVDPYSGSKRMELLRQAYEANNVSRVVAFFNGYRSEHAVVTPPPAAPSPPKDAPPVKLEEMVAPGAPKPGPTGAQDGAGKRVWTQAEIAKFYNDCRAGKFKTQQARRDEIERDIFAAQREGRIR